MLKSTVDGDDVVIVTVYREKDETKYIESRVKRNTAISYSIYRGKTIWLVGHIEKLFRKWHLPTGDL